MKATIIMVLVSIVLGIVVEFIEKYSYAFLNASQGCAKEAQLLLSYYLSTFVIPHQLLRRSLMYKINKLLYIVNIFFYLVEVIIIL